MACRKQSTGVRPVYAFQTSALLSFEADTRTTRGTHSELLRNFDPVNLAFSGVLDKLPDLGDL